MENLIYALLFGFVFGCLVGVNIVQYLAPQNDYEPDPEYLYSIWFSLRSSAEKLKRIATDYFPDGVNDLDVEEAPYMDSDVANNIQEYLEHVEQGLKAKV